jgi:hypothetical protein
MTSLSGKHSKGSWERLYFAFAPLPRRRNFFSLASELRSVAYLLRHAVFEFRLYPSRHDAVDEVAQHLLADGSIEILPKAVERQMLLRLVQSVMGTP